MRTYGQFCGLARALDVVGDRWTLLIVRELLLLGAARYSELQEGLPDIATNLLADRLRELEEAGLVVRETPGGRTSTTFRLTPRGQELEPVIAALGRWGGPLLGAPREREHVRGRWLALPLRLYYTDADRRGARATIECRVAGDVVTLTLDKGRLETRIGGGGPADLTLAGGADALLKLLSGRASVAESRRHGLSVDGDVALLKRLRRRPAE